MRRCPRCGESEESFPTISVSYRLKSGGLRRKRYELNYCAACLRRQKNEGARRRRRGESRDTQGEQRQKKWLDRARLTAALPVPVLKPFVEAAIVQVGGRTRFAEVTGVAQRRIWSILNETQKGVSVEIVDRLAAACDFTLGEITERAEEWALLTGDSWPRGYKRAEGHNGRTDPEPMASYRRRHRRGSGL